MIKLTCSISMFFNNFFINAFLHIQKMPKDSLAKYCQNNKERLQKNLMKDTKVFSKKKK